MTKTKITKKSNNKFTDEYKFKRILRTPPSINNRYNERNARINRVSPVKEISILDSEELSVKSADLPITEDAFSIHRITRNNIDWPYRIQYIEQISDVTAIWVVVCSGPPPPSPQPSFRIGYSSSISIQNKSSSYDVQLDLVQITDPTVMIKEAFLHDRPIRNEAKLLELEKINNSLLFEPLHVYITGSKINEQIALDICNILPGNLQLYNCTFYNRDVAHLYMDSLSEHMSKFTNQSPIDD